MNRKKYFLSLVLLVFGYMLLPAQTETCSNKLKLAEGHFEQGKIDKIPALLENCVNKFSRQERILAYNLLIMSYIYLDNFVKADSYVAELLKFDPEYLPASSAPSEFLSLYAAYKTDPIVSFGAKAGATVFLPYILQEYGVHDLDAKNLRSRNFMPGYSVGGHFSVHPFRNAQIDFGLKWQRLDYSVEQTLLGFANVSFAEAQNIVTMPVSIRLALSGKQVYPFVRLGLSGTLVLSSSADLNRTYNSTAAFSQKDIPLTTIDMLVARKRFIPSVISGAGLAYKVPLGYLFAELNYTVAFANMVNTAERFGIPELAFDYFYVDNDLLPSVLLIEIGYTRSLYKPDKKKKK